MLGFSAVAFALARGPESLEPEDRVRLWLLLTLSVVGIVGGILPHVFIATGAEGPSIWRWWSAAYVLATLQAYIGGFVAYARMERAARQRFNGHTLTERIFVASQNLILAAVFVTQLLNSVGLVYDGEQWICLTALLLTIVQAAIMLLTIIFLRPSRVAA